jgi:hypothetical protein
MGKLIDKLSVDTVLEVLPGLSSVASKVLSGDIKSSAKVKDFFADIWMKRMLVRVFEGTKSINEPRSL